MSIFKVVAFEAFSAVAIFGVDSPMVRDGDADSFSVEDPVIRAGKADLVVPVPSGASKIRRSGGVGGREDTLTIGKIVSLVARSTVTVVSMSSALVRDGYADILIVSEIVLRASKAFLIIPVPFSTADAAGVGSVKSREDTLTVVQFVSFVARSAVTFFVVSSTLVGNGDADSVFVEEPVSRASEADLVIPVPGGTSEVGGSGVVGGRKDTLTVNEVITFVASGTVSVFIVRSTLIRNNDTSGSFFVKDPSIIAGQANLVVPVPGSTAED